MKERREEVFDVCEVFSPPRICAAARKRGFKGGWSIDMNYRDPNSGQIFDIRRPSDQKEFKKRVRRECPMVLIVSPPCTAFSIARQSEIDPKELAGLSN